MRSLCLLAVSLTLATRANGQEVGLPEAAVWVNVQYEIYARANYGTGKDVSDETIADAKEPLQIRWLDDSSVSLPVGR